jgi:hypothetical protein
MDARAVVFCATGGMDNDWQKLGDVVARIARGWRSRAASRLRRMTRLCFW